MWWLSYADEHEFRGVILIKADSFLDAAMRARVLKISPGGQVMGRPIPSVMVPWFAEEYVGRLLDKTEVNKLEKLIEGKLSL